MASTTQISSADLPSDPTQSPPPCANHAGLTAQIAYFPPLKLEHSQDNLPPLLFPLVPTLANTHQILSRDMGNTEGPQDQILKIHKVPQLSPDKSNKYEGSQELQNARNSWSYWTREKSHTGKIHLDERTPGEDVPGGRQTADEKFEANLEETELAYSSIGAQPVMAHLNYTAESSKEYPQIFQHQSDRANEGEQSYPNSPGKTCWPSSTLQSALVAASQQKGVYTDLHPKSPEEPLLPYGYKNSPQLINHLQSPKNSTIPERGETSHSGANRRSYSLTMSSHPPFHLAQSNSWSERQRRDILPQEPSTAGNLRQHYKVKSPHPSIGPFLEERPLRHLPSIATHSRAFEKHLVCNSFGRLNSNSRQHPQSDPKPMLFNNSYQPPHDTRFMPGRYSTRSLGSKRPANFSYPRTYSDPSTSKRWSINDRNTYNETEYEERSTTTMVSGNERNSPSSYEAYVRAVRRIMSESFKEETPGNSQRDPETHCDMTPGVEKARTNGSTLIVSQRPSIQPQTTYQSNSYTSDRPNTSPVHTFGYQGNKEPRSRMGPRNYNMPSTNWRGAEMGLDGEVHNNSRAITNSIDYTNPKMSTFLPEKVAEKGCMKKFGFTTTLDAASRPYTPDHFAVEAGLTDHNSTATRNPSRNSIGSLMSTRQPRRQSVDSTGSTYTVPRSDSSNHEHNALRRQAPALSIWPSIKPMPMMPMMPRGAGGNNFPSSPTPVVATTSFGVLGAFRERRKVARELKDATKQPHTATTCAGPARVSIRGDSPPLPPHPSVYQPGANQLRLDSLAREGKAKYDSVTREFRQFMTTKNEPEIAKRTNVSPPVDNQDSASFKNHKNENPSTMRSGDSLQYGASRTITPIKPQITCSDAIGIKSPTSDSGYLYVSTVYNESQRIVGRIWEKGIGGRLANWKSKNNAERSLRYGSSGKKVKVYMSGARGESLTALEKIGRKVGINNPSVRSKGKASAAVSEKVEVAENESDPLGIGLCGAIDITNGRRDNRDSGRWSERGFSRVSPIGAWKEFEEEELVDPVKLKLEGEGSKRYWSSRDEVEAETSLWGKFRKFVTKKVTKPK